MHDTDCICLFLLSVLDSSWSTLRVSIARGLFILEIGMLKVLNAVALVEESLAGIVQALLALGCAQGRIAGLEDKGLSR